MMRLLSKKYLFILTLFLILPLSAVSARTVEKTDSNGTICVGNNLYSISQAGENVVLSDVTLEHINGKDGVYPANCYCKNDSCLNTDKKTCKSTHSFNSQDGGKKCKVTKGNGPNNTTGYTFSTCPGDDYTKIINDMIADIDIQTGGNFNLPKYKIVINNKNHRDKHIAFRYCIGNHTYSSDNGSEIDDKSHGCGSFAGKHYQYFEDLSNLVGSDWFHHLNTINNYKSSFIIDASTEYEIVFYYLNGGDHNDPCNGTEIGFYRSGTSVATVENDKYNDTECEYIRKSTTDYPWLKNTVPECYQERITATEANDFYQRIEEIYTNIISTLSVTNTTPDTISATCQFDENANNKELSEYSNILLPSGTDSKSIVYWSAKCSEKLKLGYDLPQKAIAGMSFPYTATVNIERTCTPIMLTKPVKRENCQYFSECLGGVHGPEAAVSAGPNDDFDDCISECDGGKYTQSCIDSCYDKVYNNTRTTSIIKGKMSFLNSTKVTNISFINNRNSIVGGNIGYCKDPNDVNTCDITKNIISSDCVITSNGRIDDQRFDSNATDNGDGTWTVETSKCSYSCYVDSDWLGYNVTMCKTQHGVSVVYLDPCNGTGDRDATTCYEVYSSGSICNQSGDYEAELKEFQAQYDDIMDKIKTYKTTGEYKIDDEEYTLTISEKYEDKNSTSTTMFNNKSGNRITYNLETNGDEVGTKTKKTVNGKDFNTTSYQINTKLDLSIGAAYVAKKSGEIDNNNIIASNVIYNTTNDQTDKSKDGSKDYFGPYNSYFTALNTKLGVNDYTKWPDKIDYDIDYNIKIDLDNIGTWNQWNTTDSDKIFCFYGTKAPSIDDDCDPDKEICNGMDYIFRTIDLTDVFPNDRNPRFNWTGTITADGKATGAALLKNKSYYQFAVDPVALTETIERKGESIYTETSEIDYEFILTKQNIQNIRKYNKNVSDYNGDGKRNYLDYNLSCHEQDGREVCTSIFLDNTDGNDDGKTSGEFITYGSGHTITTRKNISICNNAKGGSCVSATDQK